MKKNILLVLYVLFTQSIYAQHWAELHFDSLGINNYYNIRYIGKHLFVAQDRGTDRYGYINKDGEIIIPFEYDWLGGPSEGLIQARRKRKGGYINLSKEVLIPFKYKEVFQFQEGVASVSKNGKKYGFIDKNENVIIPFEFDYSQGFSEGFAAVLVGDKWGYINHKGEFNIPTLYDSAYDFIQGSARVGVSDEERLKYALIDKHGKLLTDIWYNRIGELKGDKYIVETDRYFGIIDVKGQEIVPCIYTSWSRGMFHEVLWLDEKKKIIDDKGNITEDHPIFNPELDFEGKLPF